MERIDWLTPETAIGARLPCGATVVGAYLTADGVTVNFDRDPQNDKARVTAGRTGRTFNKDGSHELGYLPDLIPPAPAQPDGVWVTREAALRIIEDLAPACLSPQPQIVKERRTLMLRFADALGIPPEPPKVAPWEAAYEAWLAEQATYPTREKAVRWAIEWCVGQIGEELSRSSSVRERLTARIMGDA